MAAVINEHQTSPVKTMQLNDQKAGMQGLDKEAINKVIFEASKGTPFFTFQEKRQQRIDKQVKGMLAELKSITDQQRAESLRKVDILAMELEAKKDFSRSIVHIDMDAYYAAVEMLDNPELKTKPMAVGSSSMLSTSNYVARKFGVRAAMPGFIAKKLCPELIIIPPHFDKYVTISKQVKNIIKEYDPNYASMSLDEVYLDLTDYIINRHQSQKHSKYCIAEHKLSQFSLGESENEELETKENGGIQICENDNEAAHRKCRNCIGPISDKERDTLAYEIVEEIRNRIFETTQLTASAGIAPNTMLAKVCSDQNKPNGQYQIHSNVKEVKSFITTLPVRKVSGIGPVQSQLLNGIGINTCGDLWNKRDLIALLFTSMSLEFYVEVSMGLGHTTVKHERARKSIGVEVTFKEIQKPAELHQKCEELCDEMIDDLKSHNMVGKVVVLKIKNVNFDVHTRNSTLPVHTSDKDIITKAAKKLLDNEISACAPQPLRLRLMGIRMANLINENEIAGEKQAKLKDFLKPQTADSENENCRKCPVCHIDFTQNSVCNCEYTKCHVDQNFSNSSTANDMRNEGLDYTVASTSKDIIVNENNFNRVFNEQVEIKNTLTCPVCGIEQNTVELVEFNAHVDCCLSKKAIREILSSEMIISTAADKRKNSSPKPSKKKMKQEQRKFKKINEYFH